MGLIITFVIVLASFAGIVFIVWRKIPLLKELPEHPAAGAESMRGAMAEKTKSIVSSQKEKFLKSQQFGKTLGKAKTLVSTTERQTSKLVGKFQRKQEERREEFSESYWDQLRKKSKKVKK